MKRYALVSGLAAQQNDETLDRIPFGYGADARVTHLAVSSLGATLLVAVPKKVGWIG